jgi:hypothetical protein
MLGLREKSVRNKRGETELGQACSWKGGRERVARCDALVLAHVTGRAASNASRLTLGAPSSGLVCGARKAGCCCRGHRSRKYNHSVVSGLDISRYMPNNDYRAAS